jgi:hypothetical protein
MGEVISFPPRKLRLIQSRQDPGFFFACPQCGAQVDKRDLSQVIAHQERHSLPPEQTS